MTLVFLFPFSLLEPKGPTTLPKKAYHSGAREGQEKKDFICYHRHLTFSMTRSVTKGGDTISFSLCRIRPVMALLEDPFGSVLYCYETL